MTTKSTTPVELFCSYADADEKLRKELEKYLKPLMREGKISVWHNREIMPGSDSEGEIDKHLNTAQIILLLVSPDFIASDYCYDLQMRQAIDRHSSGKARVIPIILRPADWQNTPFGKLQPLPTNGKPVSSWNKTGEAFLEVASGIRRVIDDYLGNNATLLKNKQTFDESVHEKGDELQALDSNYNDFIQNLLKNFIGRQQELIEIRQRIAEIQIQPTGGYIVITGAAGQGKSCIIAKLVEEYESQNVASHFILFNSGPDYQITLLKHLMAHFIRKHQFSDLYIATESLPALHDYFSIILGKIAERGGHEVIFIDGLEQFEEVQAEMHDISFLPHNLPPGIVFVLGISTENIKFFEMPKPHYEYHLPKLNISDFGRILQQQHIQLEREQIDQLYVATQGNALYLDLTVEELKRQGTAAIEKIIVLLTNHPENLFSLTMTHLEDAPNEWNEVLKPMLGVFMATREPLSIESIRQILDIEEDRLEKGLKQLGRLVVENSQNRYGLFHSEIYKYLHQDKRFSAMEWHKKFVNWCEKSSLSEIWDDSNDLIEQQRRMYTRHHYITHLYFAGERRSLFKVLDDGHYEQAKIRFLDPDTRSYIRDLDLGRQATVWQDSPTKEQIKQLPHLWRYSLLRCSLTNLERQYPAGAFRLLVLLKNKKEALQLAELLTDPISKAKALLDIARQMQEQSEHNSGPLEILLRAYTVVDAIEENMYQRSAILLELGRISTQAQEWERAKLVWNAKSIWDKIELTIDSIQDSRQQADTLQELGRTMAQAEQWADAKRVIEMIQDDTQQAEAILELGRELTYKQHWKQADSIWRKARRVINFIQNSEQQTKVLRKLGREWTQARQWTEAERVIDTMQDSKQQMEALRELGRALAQAQLWERAETAWVKATQVIQTPQYIVQRVMILSELGRALTQAHQWERAESVGAEAERLAKTLQGTEHYVEALLELSKASTQTIRVKTDQIIDTIQDSEQHIESLVRQQKMQKRVKGGIVQAVEEKIEQEQERSKEVWAETEQVISTIQDNEQHDEASWELGSILIQAQQWEKAKRVIGAIRDKAQQTEALLKLGQALNQEQLWEQTRAILTKIVQMIENIQDSKQINTDVNELARALVQADLLVDAERVIKTIQDNEQQAQMLSELARKLMQIQNWEEAERIIDTMQDSKQQMEALRELGRALAQAQLWERAETVWVKAKKAIEVSRHIVQRVMVLSELGRALNQAQELERAKSVWAEAERLAKTLQDTEYYVEALLELSNALAQSQQWERAELMTYLIPVEQRTEAILELGRALIQARQWDKARLILNDLEGSEQYVEAVLELVRALVEARQWSDAERMVKTIEKNKEQHTEATRELWKALIQKQRWDKAEQTIENIQDSEHHAEALCLLGEALARVGQREQAQGIWMKLERTIYTIQDREQWDEAMCILGRTLSKVEQWDKAEQVIDTIQDRELKDNALGELEGMLIQAQEWRGAKRLISFIQDKERAIEALCVLGQTLTLTEQWEQAQIIWEEVERTLSKIKDFNQRNSAAQKSAHVLIQAQQWNRAERVAGIIVDREQWIETLLELVRSLAQAQLGERAKQLISTIQNNELQTRALRELEKVVNGEQGRSFQEKVEELMDSIQDPGKQIGVLSELRPTNIRDQQREQAEDSIGRRQRDRQGNTNLSEQVRTLTQAQQWEQAENLIGRIQGDRQRNTALSELARALAQAQQWEQAENLIGRIQDDKQRNTALNELGTTLVAANKYEELLDLAQRSWLHLQTREDAIALLPLAFGFISIQPAIGTAFCNTFDWVDDFLIGK